MMFYRLSLVLYVLAHAGGAFAADPPPMMFKPVASNLADLTPKQAAILSRIKSTPSCVNVQVMTVEPTQLVTPHAVRFTLGATRTMDVPSFQVVGEGALKQWIGQFPDPKNQVRLVINGKNVTGTVVANGEQFSIQPLGGGLHAISKRDHSKYPEDETKQVRDRLEKEFKEKKGTQDLAPADASGATHVMRLLVLYTPQVDGVVADVPGLVQLAIQETNTGYEASGIPLRAELAHIGSTTYNQSPAISTDLSNLATTGDGLLDEVHTLREQVQADVCLLIVDNGEYCGEARAIGATSAEAFAVVHYDCATGYYSFAHEIGHLQGAHHNPDHDPSGIAYAHGYQRPALADRCIMAYQCATPCIRINRWSNPDTTITGQPFGTVANNNNARILRETARLVASFR